MRSCCSHHISTSQPDMPCHRAVPSATHRHTGPVWHGRHRGFDGSLEAAPGLELINVTVRVRALFTFRRWRRRRRRRRRSSDDNKRRSLSTDAWSRISIHSRPRGQPPKHQTGHNQYQPNSGESLHISPLSKVRATAAICLRFFAPRCLEKQRVPPRQTGVVRYAVRAAAVSAVCGKQEPWHTTGIGSCLLL